VDTGNLEGAVQVVMLRTFSFLFFHFTFIQTAVVIVPLFVLQTFLCLSRDNFLLKDKKLLLLQLISRRRCRRRRGCC
jgi:hypothetical protein